MGTAEVPMSLGSLSQAPLSALLSVAGLHRGPGPSSSSHGRSSTRGGSSSATVSTPQLLGLSPSAFSSFMDGGVGGASLFQEALSAPLSAQRPLTTTHRRSPRLSDSPLWGVGNGGFLAGSEVADMLK